MLPTFVFKAQMSFCVKRMKFIEFNEIIVDGGIK